MPAVATAPPPKKPKPATAQLSFNFKLGNQQWFSIKQAAHKLGMKTSFVENLYDTGQISGLSHNGRRPGEGARFAKRIPREWLEAYMMRQSDFDHGMHLQMARGVLDTFTNQEDLLDLALYARRLAAQVLTQPEPQPQPRLCHAG